MYIATAFQGLLSHLSGDQTDLSPVMRLNSGLSRLAQYDTLIFEVINESSLTRSSSSVTQEALSIFFKAVLHTSNHTWDYESKASNQALQRLVMDTLVAMIRSSKTQTILLWMISEQNSTFEASKLLSKWHSEQHFSTAMWIWSNS